jgi:hypothetical protein
MLAPAIALPLPARRTIMVLPTNATKNDTMAHGHYQRK